MFNLAGQRKALILIIKDEDMQILTWENKVLSHNALLAANEDSIEVFGRFLDNHIDYPAIIIADVIEESFRHDSVAHVSANDRKAILGRKLEYLFRGSPFRVARVTSRQTTGRRDDNVLLSALTKPEAIEFWVDVLLNKKIAIQSVTSAAYILEKYARKQELGKTENLLLVSLEEESSFRQTYLQNGRVLFSRSTKLELQEDSPGVAIRKETLHIRKYLERVKLLELDSDLKFHVLSPFKSDQIATAFRSTDSFESLRTQDEAKTAPIELHGTPVSTLVVVLAEILQHTRPSNIYAQLDIKRFHLLRRISQSIVAMGVAFLIASIFVQTPVFIDVLNKWEQRDSVVAATKPYEKEYDRLSQRFPETPIPSKEMALVVSTAQKIQNQSLKPILSMNIIGEALVKSPDLQITALHWSLDEKASTTQKSFDPFGVVRNLGGQKGKFRQAVIEERTSPTITIEGIAYSPRSYREAQAQVESLVSALREYSNVVSVTPTKMPTDVRSDASVNTTVDDAELRAEFALQVTLESNS